MSLPKLHLETTIPSYLTARRSRDLRLAADQEATQEWWEERRADFDLFISETVLREVGQGDAGMVAARAAGAGDTALATGIIPAKAADDAAHVAHVALAAAPPSRSSIPPQTPITPPPQTGAPVSIAAARPASTKPR